MRYLHHHKGIGNIPVAGLVSDGVQLVTNAAALWMNSIQTSHNADTATTLIVNGLEDLLKKNVAAYLASPGSCADQAQALANFDSAILWLQSPKACGYPGYGSAGNRCISDRIGGLAKFPWTTWYRDPIANDPRAVVNGCASAITNSPDSSLQSASANISNLISGSYQQTNPGQFANTTSSSSPISNLSNFFTPTTGVNWPLWIGIGIVGLFLVKEL